MNSRNYVLIIALFVLISVLAVSANAESAFSGIMENIRKWFESSPLGSIFSPPVKSTEELTLAFDPEDLTLEVTEPINITTNTSRIIGFSGSLSLNREEGVVLFTEPESGVVIEQDIDIVTVDNLKIPKFKLTNTALEVKTGNWEENTQNGSIEIRDFIGKGTITRDRIEFSGNVSKIIKD